MNETPRQQGIASNKRRQSLSDNPYVAGRQRDEWQDGWWQQEQDRIGALVDALTAIRAAKAK